MMMDSDCATMSIFIPIQPFSIQKRKREKERKTAHENPKIKASNNKKCSEKDATKVSSNPNHSNESILVINHKNQATIKKISRRNFTS